MDERYIDLRELSRRTSLSARTLRARVLDSGMPAYRIGGKLLFRWAEVEAWIDAHRVKPLDVDDVANGVVASLGDAAAGDHQENPQ